MLVVGDSCRKEVIEHGGETSGVHRPKGSFEVGEKAVGRKISVCTSKQHPQEEEGHTGRAVDSSSPQSRTRPVILPAERRASRWLEANDMDGIWQGVSWRK
jgi:hypothetical protein